MVTCPCASNRPPSPELDRSASRDPTARAVLSQLHTCFTSLLLLMASALTQPNTTRSQLQAGRKLRRLSQQPEPQHKAAPPPTHRALNHLRPRPSRPVQHSSIHQHIPPQPASSQACMPRTLSIQKRGRTKRTAIPGRQPSPAQRASSTPTGSARAQPWLARCQPPCERRHCQGPLHPRASAGVSQKFAQFRIGHMHTLGLPLHARTPECTSPQFPPGRIAIHVHASRPPPAVCPTPSPSHQSLDQRWLRPCSQGLRPNLLISRI